MALVCGDPEALSRGMLDAEWRVVRPATYAAAPIPAGLSLSHA